MLGLRKRATKDYKNSRGKVQIQDQTSPVDGTTYEGVDVPSANTKREGSYLYR